jgi:hypothetical protein
MKKNEKADGGGRRRQQASSSSAAAALQQQGLSAGVITFASFSGGGVAALPSSPPSPTPTPTPLELGSPSADLDPHVAMFLKQVSESAHETSFTCETLVVSPRPANVIARRGAKRRARCCSCCRQASDMHLTAAAISVMLTITASDQRRRRCRARCSGPVHPRLPHVQVVSRTPSASSSHSYFQRRRRPLRSCSRFTGHAAPRPALRQSHRPPPQGVSRFEPRCMRLTPSRSACARRCLWRDATLHMQQSRFVAGGIAV